MNKYVKPIMDELNSQFKYFTSLPDGGWYIQAKEETFTNNMIEAEGYMNKIDELTEGK